MLSRTSPRTPLPVRCRYVANTYLVSQVRVMFFVPLLNSSISILVLRDSCVSFVASNRNVFGISMGNDNTALFE
jgi:hypothetical protein